ncbi:MAG: CbiX/SirB N-terminal domain-containing protein [Rhodoferax sp.]|jgi:sirohydrochlorin cobaltochelatase|nr:CbiX/SirB N-terminal domain-containing protein [Rhodoferax sp.]MCL4736990.1 CbiX/SirB N-terminal domain-containing protein [Burkholderiaceae bacterium]MCP5288986.1 CbiX/SirB N-terminal domain-containing protein [Burkholderiaceae bacterium]
MKTDRPHRGLVLFAHGARDPRWAAPFEAVAARVRAHRPGVEVRLAYLDLMQPDLPTAGAELAAAGCGHVGVLPLFLGAGGHVREDLPRLLDALRAAHPGVQWVLHPPLGELPAFVDAMAVAALDLMDAGPAA